VAKEIERRWLVPFGCDTDTADYALLLRQGYLSLNKNTVRARTSQKCYANAASDPKGFLTVKFDLSSTVRDEYEYEIPFDDAVSMIDSTMLIVEKTRWIIKHKKYTYELDVFIGSNAGLVMVEVEFESEEERDYFTAPQWFGREVTHERKYTNAALAQRPFKEWE